MSYIIQEPNNFLNMKLTDTGRRLLSLGKLSFKKVVLSDREIDYRIGRNSYNICENAILNVHDDNPLLSLSHFDGTPPTVIDGQNLGSARQIVSALTENTGFFTGDTNNFYINTATTEGSGSPLGIGVIDYSSFVPSGGTEITLSSTSYTAQTGDLVYIPWETIQYSAITNSTTQIFSGRPQVSLWYRVQSSTGNSFTVDRNIPSFGTAPIASSNQKINTYFYPYNGIETYYGSASTVHTGVWNMNIVRTTSVIGTTSTMSGYSSYGSIEYNGTKLYLGFSSDTKAFGIVHYSNKFTGNTYAEQLAEGTFQMDIPNIMWHRNAISSPTGNETIQGLTLYDVAGNTVYDSLAKTTYRNLRDSRNTNGLIVGRVYHKLKIAILFNQELLAALTYKSNRNYTLPTPNVNLNSSPNPLYPNQTGLCKSGKTYFVSYIVESNTYDEGGSFGYPQPFHFTDIVQVPSVPNNTPNQFLKVNFPVDAFPFMRNTTNLNALSGTGWNANKIQILVKEMDTASFSSIIDVPTTDWKLISSGYSGNGIYTGETTDLTIDPIYLQAKTFIISQEDYDSGTTYSLTGQFSGFTSNNDIGMSGLTFGSESFFYGNIKTGIISTVFKTVITVYAKNSELNSSKNPTFDGTLDNNTYITEIGILDNNDNLVAVGKPAYPIKKNSSRYLAFQLELDF